MILCKWIITTCGNTQFILDYNNDIPKSQTFHFDQTPRQSRGHIIRLPLWKPRSQPQALDLLECHVLANIHFSFQIWKYEAKLIQALIFT